MQLFPFYLHRLEQGFGRIPEKKDNKKLETNAKSQKHFLSFTAILQDVTWIYALNVLA